MTQATRQAFTFSEVDSSAEHDAAAGEAMGATKGGSQDPQSQAALASAEQELGSSMAHTVDAGSADQVLLQLFGMANSLALAWKGLS